MANLHVTEIKAFVPARDFELSKRFYQDLGFFTASEGGGVAYFRYEHASFLLQDFCLEAPVQNFTMHLLVACLDDWYQHIQEAGIAEKYQVQVGPVELHPWRMRDFVIADPSGVLWCIAENVDADF
jgi:catechol 2,3-dioxygenase-like lactoylglutathione lyase family enzyme